MVLPFTIDQFMGVFAAYNDTIWPIQIVLNLLGIAAIGLALRSERYSRIVAAILAVLWVWTGAVYHLTFFVTINPAAVGFGSSAGSAAGSRLDGFLLTPHDTKSQRPGMFSRPFVDVNLCRHESAPTSLLR